MTRKLMTESLDRNEFGQMKKQGPEANDASLGILSTLSRLRTLSTFSKQMDGRTVGPTDTHSYRDAQTHLKHL